MSLEIIVICRDIINFALSTNFKKIISMTEICHLKIIIFSNCYKFCAPQKIVIVVILTFSQFTSVYVPKDLENAPARFWASYTTADKLLSNDLICQVKYQNKIIKFQ